MVLTRYADGVVMFAAPPAPQPAGIMNNGAKDVTKDIQKLQQQLQDIKDQVWQHWGLAPNAYQLLNYIVTHGIICVWLSNVTNI